MEGGIGKQYNDLNKKCNEASAMLGKMMRKANKWVIV